MKTMKNKTSAIILTILFTICLTYVSTIKYIQLKEDYELLSNEELENITTNAYIRGTIDGALYTYRSGNITYIDENNTIQEMTLDGACYNWVVSQQVNNQGGK